MNVIESLEEFRYFRAGLPGNLLIPFVPTMGALHDGHASLVRHARQLDRPESTAVVASIFVNPTQFGPTEDYTRYPRTLEADLQLLATAGCDVVFIPTAAEMYPALSTQSSALSTSIDPGPLGATLEGAVRPGHFRGVCTVVAKLLNIVQPTLLLLGQKDFQQQAVLRQMCRDLDFPVRVVTCPTLRETDGLAMSSRNRYLTPEERPRAAALYAALSAAQNAFNQGERRAPVLEKLMQETLTAAHLEPQYAVVAHAETLTVFTETITPPAVLLIAAKLGTTRLIDNLNL